MTITLKPYDKFVIIPDGKYLVKTMGAYDKLSSPYLNQIHYLEARCHKVWDKERQVWKMSVDVSNQTVTDISVEPLDYNHKSVHDEEASIH